MSKNKKKDTEFDAKSLAGKSMEKLIESQKFLKKELFNLRFQQASGELTNTSGFAKVRKNIARINTEISRRKIAGE